LQGRIRVKQKNKTPFPGSIEFQPLRKNNVKLNEITVEASDLKRTFQTKTKPVVALDGVSLQVRDGEIFGVLGPNGAGKTTTIRILSTLLLPTSGWAKVKGFDVATEPEKVRRVINMASGAEKAGYDFISARTNLWFFSQLYGIPSDVANKRINELSELLGLTKYLERKFYALSTGYRQRATIARAFINEPSVVFLDEPTIGLDVMTAMSIREFLRTQAKDRGRTIIVATHNMAEAESICDRIAIIDQGRIIATGSPESLKRSYGAPSLVLEVRPMPVNLDFLHGIEGVKGFTSTMDQDQGLTTVQVVMTNDKAVNSIVDAMEKSGYDILSTRIRAPTIEEVFISLVGKGFAEREEKDE
jgi:ABC-2 type transport system ATP-binding protein